MLDDWQLNKSNKVAKLLKKDNKITIENIVNELKDCDDLIVKEIVIKKHKKAHIVCINGMVNSFLLDECILKPINRIKKEIAMSEECEYCLSTPSFFKQLEMGNIPHIETKHGTNLDEIVKNILMGFACLVYSDVKDKAMMFDVKGYETRAISEPSNENIIKGNKESFIENVKENVTMCRRKINSKELKVKDFSIGNLTNTRVSVIYVDNIVDKEVLQKVIDRINAIDIESLKSPAQFEENMVDNKYSIFPQMQYTERVDKFTANLLEGEVGIFIDGIAIGYIAPGVLNMFFQTPDDYSFNYIIASALRVIRYLAAFLTILVPGLYVAITTFHIEMIPTDLAVSIIQSKQNVPFTTIIEVIFMLIAFEMLIEAGARLPKLIGQTISIVGGLIVGEAAVNAKFTSPAVVVVVAIAGITGFLIPNQDFSNATRVLRFLLVILSGIGGVFGLSLGIIFTVYYLASIESFGVPYLVPFTSNLGKNLTKDTIVRGIIPNKK